MSKNVGNLGLPGLITDFHNYPFYLLDQQFTQQSVLNNLHLYLISFNKFFYLLAINVPDFCCWTTFVNTAIKQPQIFLNGSNSKCPPPPMKAMYRRCDLWHLMFTIKPQSLDFLQARFVHSSMEGNIKSYILWRLHCLILINFWYDERGHISKLVQLLLS